MPQSRFKCLFEMILLPGILYQGRGKRSGDVDDGGERYTFGRKKMLLRQMQITVFHGLEPIAVFTEKTTAKNLAAFASATLARQGSY